MELSCAYIEGQHHLVGKESHINGCPLVCFLILDSGFWTLFKDLGVHWEYSGLLSWLTYPDSLQLTLDAALCIRFPPNNYNDGQCLLRSSYNSIRLSPSQGFCVQLCRLCLAQGCLGWRHQGNEIVFISTHSYEPSVEGLCLPGEGSRNSLNCTKVPYNAASYVHLILTTLLQSRYYIIMVLFQGGSKP